MRKAMGPVSSSSLGFGAYGFGAQEILLLTAEVRRALTRCVCIVVVVVVIQALIARQVELQSRTKRPQSHRSRLVALGSRV